MSGITVGIDGSDNSHHALIWAMQEAAVRGVPLTVIAVHETIKGYWTGQPVHLAAEAGQVRQVREAAEQAVATAVKEIGEDNPVQVTVSVIDGFAAKELIAASASSDLLVVGTRGGGGFPRLHLGSVSSQVVHHAECPVVVVPHDR